MGLHPVWVLVIISLSLTSFHAGYAQVVNAYAKVTAISGKVLTVKNVNETFHTFNIGEKVIVMQMQDKHSILKLVVE